MIHEDAEVFEGKSLSDLLRDIYIKSDSRSMEIKEIVGELVKKIGSTNDAIIMAPIIHQFLEVSVKNDEHLIKIGTIVQRIISAESYKGGEGTGELLSESEKEQLINNHLGQLKGEVSIADKEFEDISETLTKSIGTQPPDEDS